MSNHHTKNNARISVVLNKSPEKRASTDWFVSVEEKEKHEILVRFENKLANYIGLKEIKSLVKELYAWIYISERRKEVGLKSPKQVLHMIFKGNPGTGKTTVARLIASFLHEMKVLSKGHFIEMERADLVGEYIGHTAQKTRDVLKQAQGGVLFIDEAYSLSRGGEKDFGKEAIDTLVRGMENHANEFVLILAGYSKEMDFFMSLNPGLPSRFPISITFPNYAVEELIEMLIGMAKERDYIIEKDALNRCRDQIKHVLAEEAYSFSNGRYMRNMIEEAIRLQAVRVLKEDKFTKSELETLRKEDFTFKK
ncbi:stage V sporulation protein K [Shouchella sp. JSM 1781072]|uniref:stage V sporulation protein K n=1 Tax=Bacillaceae TaxID=186817 RepID=UPI000C082378|nr:MULTISPECIES: stage V sporulation protein K [Bacillaceae]UTR04692.1 stage V sporulation protein K [Alkalihalobacillus sp. LMS6]